MTRTGSTYLRRTRAALGTATALLCLLSAPAFAQDAGDPKTETLDSAKTTRPTEGLNFNLPTELDLRARPGPNLELPINAVGSTLFKLDLSSPACATAGENCLRRDGRMDLGLTDTFRRTSKKGLDLSLTPRASMRFDDESSSAVVGAVVEIGKDLRQGAEFENNTWYFFAGADAEALTYAPNSVSRITSGQFHLQDRIIVGDAQAGLGYRIGDADVSLSYMRREASTEEFSFKEDAAALSFTWKR